MEYLWFTLWFTLLHTMAYTVAGAIALNVSGDLYTERARTLDFLRNMSDVEESGHVQRWFLPAQVVRGVVLSVVLYPVLGPLGDLSGRTPLPNASDDDGPNGRSGCLDSDT